MKKKKSDAENLSVSPAVPLSPEGATQEPKSKTDRRSFLARVGLGATLLALGGQAYAFLRSLIPNVLYEQPRRFKVGLPDQFGEGAKFLEDKRLFIFRQRNTFYVVSAVCTHLGCTVKMERLNQPKKVRVGGHEFEEQVEFHCPCHGSKYYGDGTNYSGPAPKPLAYYRLEVSPDDGQLTVDMTESVGQDFRLTV
jgi:menaquinol-cytochrome c reductase iron-sulfur subunit